MSDSNSLKGLNAAEQNDSIVRASVPLGSPPQQLPQVLTSCHIIFLRQGSHWKEPLDEAKRADASTADSMAGGT